MYFISMRGALGKAYSALRQCTYNFEDWSANYIRLAPHKNLFQNLSSEALTSDFLSYVVLWIKLNGKKGFIDKYLECASVIEICMRKVIDDCKTQYRVRKIKT